MTTSVERPAAAEAAPVSSAFTARERWVLLVASAWLVIGLQLDAYAHATTPQLETFWTPWHGVLYSGIAASGFTLLWIMKARLPSIPTYQSLLALPNALRLPLAGMASLLVGGGVDTLWHNIFGIEKNLEIFVSPSHELIILGMVLVAMGPALMTATEPGRRLGTGGAFLVAISALFAVLPLHIYSLHASALGFHHLGTGVRVPNVFSVDGQLVHGYLFSTVLLLVPILMIGRRWPLPIGLPAALVAIPALLMHLMFDSEAPWWPQLTVAIAAPVVELALRVANRLVTLPVTGRWVALGLIAPPAVWGAVLLVGKIQTGTVGWNVHMVTGLLTLVALTGAGTVLVTRSIQFLQRS
ncbi:hypothetical protein ACWT_5424 [Actinoplanes sp. SE50]|uniref:hypothetical protein n=1 Tax=unclassified Actinoplanes TaxID=2626549 RepID=UPI00023EC6A0|nr:MULTISPECIES: hypothetical protein [unclassified Actinoplanes]AEV86441.1 hypothetical protein ACPL_5554 [Actinoplanes sp. SE50/110]ATO84839.1 hypothetical protein ACWT_5424 [Actinoplanes sp. SE50]SLM02248.1 uncharacterized protein ACSP50_5487 [Actinoplanes sp. SE50/110]